MGMANLTLTVTGLVAAGMSPDTPAAVVERGFSDSQRTTPGRLADLPALVGRVGVTSPAVVVIGDVAAFAAADQAGAGPRGQLGSDFGRRVSCPIQEALESLEDCSLHWSAPGRVDCGWTSSRGFRIGVTSDRRSE